MRFFRRRRTSATRSAETRLAPAKHVVATVHGTRTVLLDPRRGEYFGLDEVGGRVWALLEQRHAFQEVVDQLAREYEAERTQIENDLRALIADLQSKGLLEKT